MFGSNKLLVLLSMVTGLLLLGACGSDDAETASAPAAPAADTAAPAAEAAPAASSEGEAISLDSIEKAEGVVYKDEIYANWPYTETE